MGRCIKQYPQNFFFIIMSSLLNLKNSVISRLAGKKVVFWGTRGSDARELLDLPNLKHVISLIAPLESFAVKEICLEQITNDRVDLDSYSTDFDEREVVEQLKAELLEAFQEPCVLVPYSPCALLLSAWFPRKDHVIFAGQFHEKQGYFEHKPWVETALQKSGVKTIEWDYWADKDIDSLAALRQKNNYLVFRANRSDGGAGLSLVDMQTMAPAVIKEKVPPHSGGFFGVADYLEPNIPLNINACVYPNGQVILHPASVQLIGIPYCTRRRFGYCGNDFAAITKILNENQINLLDKMTRDVGAWLAKEGYIGAYGIDALLYNGELYFVELNPRFQGSSVISARIDQDLERPNVYLNHLAAYLDLEPPNDLSLYEIAKRQTPLSHVIAHNIYAEPITIEKEIAFLLEKNCELVPSAGTKVVREAILFRQVFEKQISKDGAKLFPKIEKNVRNMTNFFVNPAGQLTLPGFDVGKASR